MRNQCNGMGADDRRANHRRNFGWQNEPANCPTVRSAGFDGSQSREPHIPKTQSWWPCAVGRKAAYQMISLCEAIARQEGWLRPDSRCRRNHNPGNIEYSAFARAHGATGNDGVYAVFPDDTTGWHAMSTLLLVGYLNLTMAQAITKWAPPRANDTAAYIANVQEWTGITPDTRLTYPTIQPPKNA